MSLELWSHAVCENRREKEVDREIGRLEVSRRTNLIHGAHLVFWGRTGTSNEARERSDPFFPWFSKGKKPLHNGSYEHRVPEIKNKTLFRTRDVCVCDSTS